MHSSASHKQRSRSKSILPIAILTFFLSSQPACSMVYHFRADLHHLFVRSNDSDFEFTYACGIQTLQDSPHVKSSRTLPDGSFLAQLHYRPDGRTYSNPPHILMHPSRHNESGMKSGRYVSVTIGHFYGPGRKERKYYRTILEGLLTDIESNCGNVTLNQFRRNANAIMPES